MSTPNIVHIITACALFTMALSACGPDIVVVLDDDDLVGDDDGDIGDTFTGDEATMDLPVDCPGAAVSVVECDDGARCWAWAHGWSAWAQYAEPADLAAAIASHTLVPTLDDLGLDSECFDLDGAQHHVCVVTVDCVGLLGRPAQEVDMVKSECAPLGPWDSVGETLGTFGSCWGVVDGVAVMLRL